MKSHKLTFANEDLETSFNNLSEKDPNQKRIKKSDAGY